MQQHEFGPKLVLRKAVVQEVARISETRKDCPDTWPTSEVNTCPMASFVADKS